MRWCDVNYAYSNKYELTEWWPWITSIYQNRCVCVYVIMYRNAQLHSGGSTHSTNNYEPSRLAQTAFYKIYIIEFGNVQLY